MDPRAYKLPRYIYLSPRLQTDGANVQELQETLHRELANRERPSVYSGEFEHLKYGELAWSLEVTMDHPLLITEFYLTCSYIDELFYPFENTRPFWEEPDYLPPDKTS